MKWDIDEKELEEEIGRQQVNNLSFNVIFKWFNYQNKPKAKPSNSILLSKMH